MLDELARRLRLTSAQAQKLERDAVTALGRRRARPR